MKKVWLVCIFILITPVFSDEHPAPVKEVKTREKKKEKYYPLYVKGVLIDSTTVIEVGKVKVAKQTYEALLNLIEGAAQEGVCITVNSGYRTQEEQLLYRIKHCKNKFKKDDMEFILKASSSLFKPYTARPGYSRHQSGIAFDFNTKDEAVYNWLKINALQYGFVRTVPSESWHWEYLPEADTVYCYVEENHYSW